MSSIFLAFIGGLIIPRLRIILPGLLPKIFSIVQPFLDLKRESVQPRERGVNSLVSKGSHLFKIFNRNIHGEDLERKEENRNGAVYYEVGYSPG
jgi:hypothetical protein